MHQEYITLINIYAPNQGAPKNVKQLLTELKGETKENTIEVGHQNTLLSDMNRSSKQKINKEKSCSNDTLDLLDIINIYRDFHSKTDAYTAYTYSYLVYMGYSQESTT